MWPGNVEINSFYGDRYASAVIGHWFAREKLVTVFVVVR